MDALKKMGEKLKDGATEFAAKHETEINQAKTTAEELLGKAEETVGKARASIVTEVVPSSSIEVELGKETEAGTNDAEKDALKKEIDDLGGSIKSAKTDIEDKSEMKKIVDPLVAKLLAAKAKFASMNGGIGVDGKSVEKKKTMPSDHAVANVMATAKNAAKKAAKKAEKEAKKAAFKAGLIDSSVTGGSGEGSGAPSAVIADTGASSTKGGASAAKVNNAKAIVSVLAAVKASSSAKSSSGNGPPPLTNLSKFKLKPLQLVINPNVVRMNERPIITLAVACLCDVDIDLNITSDHRVPQPMLGMDGNDSNGKAIVGDLASARYLLDDGGIASFSKVLTTSNANERAEQNAWIEYSQSLTQLDPEQALKGIAMTLEYALSKRTYLCGYKISLADITLFAALGFPCTIQDKTSVLEFFKDDYPIATRWIKMMSSHPALMKATQLALVGASGSATTDAEAQFSEEKLVPLVSGMNLLEGAIPGQVVTRFPPEPSGYLHVGHAKACLLNDYYAKRYKGRLIIRFDDTNPSKEKEEYQQSILEDLATLGVKGDVLTYTSDYIGAIQKYALQMILNGQAYMDDTPQEQMKDERMERKEAIYRSTQSPEEAKLLFLDMCSGSENGSKWCLRAKINMLSDNGTMRDPVLYRQNLTPHHRTGTTHKAYPTYDLACPIVDSLEGVTHALRTTEYNDRDEQYQFLLKTLNLRRVRIHSFCRMNFQYTLLSKRKLTWFVNENLVTGWDDARFPTVRGVIRRGVSIPALKTYIYSQGASRRVVNMVWNSFWAENKKELDKSARRFMAIDSNTNSTLTIVNFPSSSSSSSSSSTSSASSANETYVSTSLHPKDPTMGKRPMKLSSKVLLEKIDADDCVVGENIVLLRWGVVKITSKKDDKLEGELIPDGDFKTTKRKYSWIAVDAADRNDKVVGNTNYCPAILTEFDHLVTKEKLEDGDKFEDYVNPNTIAKTTVIGDINLKTLKVGDVIQLERRGFYRVDSPYRGSIDKPIVLYMIPDGKIKSMSGMSGKLQHH